MFLIGALKHVSFAGKLLKDKQTKNVENVEKWTICLEKYTLCVEKCIILH